MEPEIYLKMKQFMIGSDKQVSFMEINRFSENVTFELFKRKVISSKWRDLGEEGLMDLIQDLCFEIMYARLIKFDETRNMLL